LHGAVVEAAPGELGVGAVEQQLQRVGRGVLPLVPAALVDVEGDAGGGVGYEADAGVDDAGGAHAPERLAVGDRVARWAVRPAAGASDRGRLAGGGGGARWTGRAAAPPRGERRGGRDALDARAGRREAGAP